MPYRSVFDVVWSGTAPRDDGRHPDRPLRQPEHRVHRRLGPARRRSCSACGARRATPSTTRRATGCRTTRRASFVEQVDFVSGVGYPSPTSRSTRSAGSSATWACSTSRRPTTRCGCARSTPASSSTRSIEATGFELVGRRRRARVAAAHRRGAAADPRGARPRRPARRRGAVSVMAGERRAAHPALRPARRRVPDRADRHGLGGRAPAGRGHRERGRPRHPGRGHDDVRRAARRDGRGEGAHRQAVRGEPARRPGRRRRPHRPRDEGGRAGRVVRAGAEGGPDQAAQGRRGRGHPVDRRQAPRREGGGVGRRRGARAGRRGRRPHRAGADLAAAAAGRRRASTSR